LSSRIHTDWYPRGFPCADAAVAGSSSQLRLRNGWRQGGQRWHGWPGTSAAAACRHPEYQGGAASLTGADLKREHAACSRRGKHQDRLAAFSKATAEVQPFDCHRIPARGRIRRSSVQSPPASQGSQGKTSRKLLCAASVPPLVSVFEDCARATWNHMLVG